MLELAAKVWLIGKLIEWGIFALVILVCLGFIAWGVASYYIGQFKRSRLHK